MKIPFKNKLRHIQKSEHGIAMVSVILASAVLLTIGTGMYFVATRESMMTQADYSGGKAFYYAEGGLANVLDVLNYAVTEWQLTQPRPDQSPDGFGYLMDPNPDLRQNPSNPVQMSIGGQSYTVYVDEVDQNGNHCTGCGLDPTSNQPAYLMITAEGQSSEGYRKLQQMVKVTASGFPLTFYVDGNAQLDGTTTLTNQSIFVRGDLFGRDKLTLSGTDLMYGGGAGVFATGSIYAMSNGHGSQIYNADGSDSRYWSSNDINDRDSQGPTGNIFTVSDLQNYFNYAGGLTTNQLDILKSQAQTSGYYNGNPGSGLTIQQGDLPNRGGDIVVYVDFPSGSPMSNNVDLKFQWPPAGYTGKAIVVVKNGSVSLDGSAIGNFRGDIYCPDGSITANGNGSGTFTGFVWGKGLTDIGNFNFSMDQQFIEDPPFYAWTVTRETDWTQVDR
ncbi:MAG: pilus assembly PilX N-terminal domain-containing protein [Actinobacteria bacterium]|nr:pilus assembly PilX N-terminal domain-containing protein [Actinomycetota bacterium]